MTTHQEAVEALKWANETIDRLTSGERLAHLADVEIAEKLLVLAAASIDRRAYKEAVALARAGQILVIEVTN